VPIRPRSAPWCSEGPKAGPGRGRPQHDPPRTPPTQNPCGARAPQGFLFSRTATPPQAASAPSRSRPQCPQPARWDTRLGPGPGRSREDHEQDEHAGKKGLSLPALLTRAPPYSSPSNSGGKASGR
jgi:hypothetical protein